MEIVFQWGGDFSLEFGVSLGKSKLLRASICDVVGTMQWWGFCSMNARRLDWVSAKVLRLRRIDMG